MLYLEEFPNLPKLLDEGIEAFYLKYPDKYPILLLIDHFDRTLESQLGAFWLAQVQSVLNNKNLSIIIACRPDEYDRLAVGHLGNKLDRMRFRKEINRLTPGRGNGNEMASGEGLEKKAQSIPKGLSGHLECLAYEAKASRAIPAPINIIDKLENEFTKEKVSQYLIRSGDGRILFRHDCWQDFFAAIAIAKKLADDNSDREFNFILNNLKNLYPDAFRFLIDIISRNDDSKVISESVRRKARNNFVSGMLWNPTIQQWLYDFGRLKRSKNELEGLRKRFKKSELGYGLSSRLLGHLYYELVDPKEFGTKNYKTPLANTNNAIEILCDGLESCLEIIFAENEVDKVYPPIWLSAFLIDHIFRLLGHLIRWDENKYREAILPLMDISREYTKKKEILQTEKSFFFRIVNIIRELPNANPADFSESYIKLYELLEKLYSDPLYVRRCHVSGHIANYFAELRFSKNRQNIPEDADDKAIDWYQKSIFLRTRLLFSLENSEDLNERYESFATLPQGWADIANQIRGIAECLLHKFQSDKNVKEEMVGMFLEYIQQLKVNWWKAEQNLKTGERLPNIYRSSIAVKGIGKAIEDIYKKAAMMNRGEILEKIGKETAKEFDHYRMNAEIHGRSIDIEKDRESIIRTAKDLAKSLAEFLERR